MTLTTPFRLPGPDRPAPHAVLLDMDGTLVDTERSWFAAETAAMADFGFDLGPEHAEPLLGSPMDRAVTYLLAVSGLDVHPAELEARINAGMVATLSRGVDLRPGAAELLGALTGENIPYALVTASHRAIVDAVLPHLGGHGFHFTLAGDEVPRSKPHPDPYLIAARRVGADPAACVVVEDSPTGIAAGEAAGCTVVAVPSMTPIAPGPGRTVVQSLLHVDVAFLRALAVGREERTA